MSHVGDLLRQHRQQRGLSQEDLAALVEPPLSPDTISNVERGRTRPHRHTLDALCRALGLDDSARQEVGAAWRVSGAANSPAPTEPRAAVGGMAASQPTPLIGRDQELHVVQQRLLQPEVRLLTLVGPGGVGKTRLALALLRRVHEQFRDGARFIDLSPLRDAALVMPTIAHVLAIHEAGSQPVLKLLVDALSDRNLLLVLDNFEHLLEAAVALAEVLGACPAVKVLATSREPLRLRWEHLHVVPPLGVPDAHDLASVDAVQAAPAVALFLDRARAADASFALSPANAAAIGTLCRRLDGLPLALELAAARVRTLSPGMLLEHVDRQLDLLAGPRDAPTRQRTLRATLDWSYDLLAAPEQRLFERLSVFAGGWTLGAAEAVCVGSDLESSDVLDVLSRLVAKSLVLAEPEPDGSYRYRLLEPLRQYAAARLSETGAAVVVRRRHLGWCLALAEAAVPALVGRQQRVWLDRLERELDNVRAALRWAVDDGDGELGLRLAGTLGEFWMTRGYFSEGRAWLQQLLAGMGTDDAPTLALVRARALHAAGLLARNQGDNEAAAVLHQESLTLARHLRDTAGIARALQSLGVLAYRRAEYARAEGLYGESLGLFRQVGDSQAEAYVLGHLGELALEQGDAARATALQEASLRLKRALGDQSGIAWSLSRLGEVAWCGGDLERASTLYVQSLALRREVGDKRGIAEGLCHLGHAAAWHGDDAAAAARYRESLELFRQLGDPRGVAWCLGGIARLTVAAGQPGDAARLLGAAEALLAPLGSREEAAHRLVRERATAAARRALTEPTFTAAWARGRAMSVQDVTADAVWWVETRATRSP